MPPSLTSHRCFAAAKKLVTGLLIVCLFAAPLAFAADDEKPERSRELAFMNGIYEGLSSELAPIEQGPLTIHITSPENRLEVHRNLFTFRPAEDGAITAAVEGEIEGGGKLIAVVEGAGTSNRFDDDLTVPRQTLAVAGKIRLEATEVGYQITIVEAPQALEIAIRSAALGQMVGACEALATLPFVPITCDGLDRALSTARVSLPEPGESFVLENVRLSEADRAFFDAFLSR